MKKILTHPLISCICITNNRPHQLLRAIGCFRAQNYPNRELLISYPQADVNTPSILNFIEQFSPLGVTKITRDNSLTLGMAKNHAIQNANGPFICIWDDDDWSPYNRLAHQYNTMHVNAKYRDASILSRVTLHDGIQQKTYLSFPYLWTGTLLCRKDHMLKQPFEDSNIAEDSKLMSRLLAKKVLHLIEDSAYLYIYNYHGTNQTSYHQYNYLLRKSEQLDEGTNEWVKNVLQ